ncbi:MULTISPECIES: DUF5701 family protein [unclassified Modestobacter]|uniref:DUF5701 family protein n=1 Tax=unclassified Modestobacter TaxID=2643866 RepID=UPI0022AA7849|nr:MULTISPECIES: DUF5701 family protein [unclassified Modestobacter]MCZ2822904.1 DUF5701 family protein [Modestobacter sp. VKM Ac-2981]MCZ2851150.1 DUF5701 family protein [Modestobacter sp. VKM Ac-2982]
MLPLPSLTAQAGRLVELGVHTIAGLTAAELCAAAAAAGRRDGALLVVHPDRAPASRLAELVEREGKRGFVVLDMTDVDAFTPTEHALLPDAQVYLVDGLERGDEMLNWSPDEALPAITARGRTPLTLGEGVHWLLQQPEALERNRCFMTIGSRLRRPDGRLDARTPALWLSNGTGRDGRGRRGAPKIGWCWAGNRHTWLGFASAAGRAAVPVPTDENRRRPASVG